MSTIKLQKWPKKIGLFFYEKKYEKNTYLKKLKTLTELAIRVII